MVYKLTQEDELLLKQVGLEQFIYTKLTSKKFRKFKMDEKCVERTKKAVKIRIQKNEPITVVYPQGGYKLWRFPSSPRSDWAEFFNISYILQYLALIAAAYKQGVSLVYYMHTLLMELHDNLTPEEIQTYVNSFQELIKEFQGYLPKNITISILRDADIYERQEYFDVLEEGKNLAEVEYKNWPQINKDRYAKMSNLNIKWKGKEDWSILSESEKQNKIYLAALYEMAATSQLKKVSEKVKSPENVLLFTKATPDFIGVGSTRTSMAKYWVGFGVIESENNTFYERVLTPSQFETVKNQKHEVIKTNILSDTNFKEIWVYPEKFNFDRK